MKILNIANQNQWDGWLKNHSQHNPFTQSWAWGDILLAEGKQVERLAVMEDDKVLAQAQIVYNNLPFGWRYAFCPQGPVSEKLETYQYLLDYLKNKNCIFFRVESTSMIRDSKFTIHRSIDINPPSTLILDLKKSEEELLAGMHQKTRYNIHLAEKKDLKINNEKNLEVFWSLMNQTGSRDKFKLHAKNHYNLVLNSPLTFQLTAYLNNTAVATAVFAKFGDTFTYLYGASDYEHRHLMAPYLLQWEGIKMGKSNGCQRYDFFGVAPVKDGNYNQNHQYAGVTRFKLGFGGTSHEAPGTFDLVINNKKYSFYSLMRKLRRLV